MAPVRIVTHNAFWFQGAPFATDQPGPPDAIVLAALVDVYRDLQPDVLAVQEVQDESAFAALGGALDLPGAYCPGGELVQYGGAVFDRAGGAIVDWRTTPTTPQRMWQVVSAAGVRVCNVHLPSSRQLGVAAAAERRLAELRAALSQLADGGVIGRWGFRLGWPPGGPVTELLSSAGYIDAAVHTGQADLPTALGGGRGDQIWVHESLVERLAEYGVVPTGRFAADAPAKEHLSDHLPVWVELHPKPADSSVGIAHWNVGSFEPRSRG